MTILADAISEKIPNLDKEWFTNKIERAHHGKPSSDAILAKDSETVKYALINHNKSTENKKSIIHVSPMYSPALNEALKERKNLMKNNLDTDVVYPAKLLKQKKGSREKYALVQEY